MQQTPDTPSFAPADFVYVKIPTAAGAEDRDLARAEALDQLLRDQDIGSVLGWGPSLGERRPDGSRPVAFHRIDIEIAELESGLAALHQFLPALGALAGTEIHYRRERQNLQDVYAEAGWRLGIPPPG